MIDIQENDISKVYPEAFALLLKDQTTQRNLLWATHDYESRGDGYRFEDTIEIELITGEHGNIIKPRVLKAKSDQVARAKIKAEIFTPSWVCNLQNNVADESWFGRKDVFNTMDLENKTWETNYEPIRFEGTKGWQAYVAATRMEITCGEAPYLASRYDATTGEAIALENRIGLLDRKLRVVGENTTAKDEWMEYAEVAFKNIYGYEWQGDSLLLARESLLKTFMEYYQAKFNDKPSTDAIHRIAYIISWNLWQMDGLKYVIPNSCHDTIVSDGDIFAPKEKTVPCEGCAKNNPHKHNGVYCLIKDWGEKDPETGEMGRAFKFVDLLRK